MIKALLFVMFICLVFSDSPAGVFPVPNLAGLVGIFVLSVR